MKVPEDRNPCLTFVAAEKKPPSKFTKKGEVLEDTHEKAQRGSRVQRCCSHVVPVKVPEDRNPCLTLFSPEKKPALRFTKKGEVLKSTHEIAMEAIRSRPSPSRDLASLGINAVLNVCAYCQFHLGSPCANYRKVNSNCALFTQHAMFKRR